MPKKDEFAKRSRLADMLGTSADVIKDNEKKEDDSQESISIEDEESESVPHEGVPRHGTPPDGIPESGILEIGIPKNKFCKVHNWIFDELSKVLDIYEWAVYIHLYRLAIGFNKDTCRIGLGALQKRTGASYNKVKDAVQNLIDKKYLVKAGEHNQEGTLYKLGVPPDGIPESGVPHLGTPPQGVPSHGIPQRDPNKDSTRDTKKDNNNKSTEKKELEKLLLSSEIVDLPEPVILELSQKTDLGTAKEWLKFIAENGEIKNPSGFLRCAIEEDWEISDRTWKKESKRKKEMERKAEKEEKRIAEEKAEWKQWLDTVSDDIRKEARDYAEEKFSQSKYTPENEEIKRDMMDGFKKEFLRMQFKQEKTVEQ